MTMLNLQRTGGDARVLLVVTSHGELGHTGRRTGLWLSELAHPYFMLHDSGVAVEIASIEGGKLVIDPVSAEQDDPDNRRFLTDPELRAQMDKLPALRDLDYSQYQGVFFVGGHGAMWDFPDNAAVHTAINHIFGAGHVVAAVCHGVAAIVNVTLPAGGYLADGKRLTAFTDEEECEVGLRDVVPFSLERELCKRGAQFVAEPAWEENIVVDGQLITGQNPASAKLAAIAMVKRLRASARA